MERKIKLKQKLFEEKSKILVQKLILFDRIVKRLTDAVFNDEVGAEAKIQTTKELTGFYDAVTTNLDILNQLCDHCDNKAASSLNNLVSIENDLTLFTYKPSNLNQYKQNANGECMIVKIGNPSIGRCYMNDLKEPELQLSSIRRENLTKFPESGEVFAVELEDQRLYRAVRSDLIFKERPKIIVYLLDVGKRVEIPYNLKNFYSLPNKIQKLESRAIPCTVVEIIDEFGTSLDVATKLQSALHQPTCFEVTEIEGNNMWIRIWLKQISETTDETVDVQTYVSGSSSELISTGTSDERQQISENSVPVRVPIPGLELICDICQSTFSTESEIAVHMNSHIRKLSAIETISRDIKKAHICRFCHKSFSHKGYLKQHLKIHTGEKLPKCSICGKAFIDKLNLTIHIETHKITCKICKKNFPQIIDLKHHIKIHREKAVVICEICGKMFSTNNVLKEHLNLHTKEKLYSCTFCERTFLVRKSLMDHLQIQHSNEKFRCEICNKMFGYKRSLKVHLKNHSGRQLPL